MLRHIFIATIKEGVADEQVNKVISNMQAMEKSVPVIKSINVGRSLGLVGPSDTVTMVIDLENEADFQTLLNSPEHHELSAHAGEVFRTDNFVLSQINI